jgi:hypothetical protein
MDVGHKLTTLRPSWSEAVEHPQHNKSCYAGDVKAVDALEVFVSVVVHAPKIPLRRPGSPTSLDHDQGSGCYPTSWTQTVSLSWAWVVVDYTHGDQ